MRVKVTVEYQGLNNQDCVLRYSDGRQAGEIFREIKPITIIRIGNSNLSFLAKPVRRPMGERAIALVDIPEDFQHLSGRDVHRELRRERGFVLYNKATYLWALTRESAENGLVHQYQKNHCACQVHDPIIAVINRLGIQGQRVTNTDAIGRKLPRGGNLCEHVREVNSTFYNFETDGHAKLCEEARYVTDHLIPNHIGCQVSPEHWFVAGGTWIVHWADRVGRNGQIYKDLVRVVVTKDANRKLVARKIVEALK
jgi:hypothetical protein